MMKKWMGIIACCFPIALFAQSLSGTVSNNNKEALIGANLYWLGTNINASTDANGQFEITVKNITTKRLIVSYIGYKTDTLDIKDQNVLNIVLTEDNILEEVVVSGQQNSVIISNLNAIKTEQITQTSLKQAACCDLAGCFGGQTSVQPQTTNVITNSKELRILGLSGVYNQVLIDGFPLIKGLSHTYGISSIPGTMVNNIYISKGSNSVLQGFESISGQINVETKDPANTDKLLVNGYINNFMEKHFNVNYAFKVKEWTSILAFHSVQPADKKDRDKDFFLDLPLLTRYSFSNKWKFGNANEWGWNSQISFRYLNEKRIGGQLDFDPNKDKGSPAIYGQSVQMNQPELTAKAGYRWDDIHNLSVYASGFYQDQNSYFGTVKYDAQQAFFNTKVQYEYTYSEKHNLKTGFSLRHSNLEETIAFRSDELLRSYAGDYQLKETIPGVFAENTMNLLDNKLTWIAGIRADKHNLFGLKWTPRTLVKYDLSPQTVLRANIGLGWRTVNLFSENINLLVSSRDIIFKESLEPEKALNYGVNLTNKFEGENIGGYFSLDFYRTDFKNQIFPDYDSDPTKAIIQNFDGKSISNGFQAEAFFKIKERFDWKIGYTLLDVYREIDGQKEALPFNAKHKVLSTFSFQPLSRKWHFDVNYHWYGAQRLPDTKQNPIEFQRPDYSKSYSVINAQFTYNLKRLELYAGCENIFDFRQKQAILSWENPYGPYFDTSSVWGPIRGREFYLGFRYRIQKE
jgi:outer membrane receptor for ferrienterochelin and colicin